VVYTHVVVGTSGGTVRAGCVFAAYAFPALEMMVDVIAMQKRFDGKMGLTLGDPAFK
jgi:predicted DNA-binding protein with PD1-like motif